MWLVRAVRAPLGFRRRGAANDRPAPRRSLGAQRLQAVGHLGRARGRAGGIGADRGLRGEGNLLLRGGEGEGFRIALIGLDGGRIGIASQAVGVARAALEASIRYARERDAFGKPIGSFQAIQWHLANMKTELDAAELLTFRAAFRKERGLPFTKEASMAKLFATEMAQRVCDKAVQIHGGYGYVDEFPVERYLRDARVQTIYEGTSEIQRFVIAREIIKSAGG